VTHLEQTAAGAAHEHLNIPYSVRLAAVLVTVPLALFFLKPAVGRLIDDRVTAYMAGGRFAQAERVAEKGLWLEGDKAQSWFRVAAVYGATEKYDDAFRAYDRGFKIDPYDTKARFDSGLLFFKRGKWAEAARSFEEILRNENVKNVPSGRVRASLVLLARSHVKTGDVAKAKAAKAELARRFPGATIDQ
jgi:tetratricopeptide (TPR) repeat protein